MKALRLALTTPRTVIRALELAARLNGELGGPSRRVQGSSVNRVLRCPGGYCSRAE